MQVLRFGPTMNNLVQTTYIHGQFDSDADGDVAYNVTLSAIYSADPLHDSLDLPSLTLSVINNDIEPNTLLTGEEYYPVVVITMNGTNTSEDGDVVWIGARLSAAPSVRNMLCLLISSLVIERC